MPRCVEPGHVGVGEAGKIAPHLGDRRRGDLGRVVLGRHRLAPLARCGLHAPFAGEGAAATAILSNGRPLSEDEATHLQASGLHQSCHQTRHQTSCGSCGRLGLSWGMTPLSTFARRTVAVFGLARSGRAACRALLAGGASVVAGDDTARSREAAAAAGLQVQDLAAADWNRFAALVLAPGVPLTHPAPHWTVSKARRAGVEVIGDIELFCRQRAARAPDSPFVAITGTNGKSTTTALLAHILRLAGRDAQMGGNIGTPILELEPPAAHRVHIIEMSSFQIELAPSLAPSIGVLINISPDHLDRHGSMEHYVALKARLLERARRAIVGQDDRWSRAVAERLRLARPGCLDLVSARERLPQGW